MEKFKNIILIGMPLSGKSTLGKIISDRLGWRFIDTDNEIARECGESIPEIFISKGERYFRLLEQQQIDKFLLSKEQNKIIACGGGMPVYFDNLNKLKDIGKVIFLDINIQTIIKRSSAGKDRPLIKENTLFSLLDLYYTRYNIYKMADFHMVLAQEEAHSQAETLLNMLLL